MLRWQRSCGSESAPIRKLDMKSGIVHLGHPAELCSQWTRETDREADLQNELQIQNLPETLPSPVSAIQEEWSEDQLLQGPLKSNRRIAGAEVPSPSSAVMEGSCSHSKVSHQGRQGR